MLMVSRSAERVINIQPRQAHYCKCSRFFFFFFFNAVSSPAESKSLWQCARGCKLSNETQTEAGEEDLVVSFFVTGFSRHSGCPGGTCRSACPDLAGTLSRSFQIARI